MFDHEYSIDQQNLPLYLKGKEIYKVSDQIFQLIPEDNKPLIQMKNVMLNDALLLTEKVDEANSGHYYDLQMESATIIRKAACELMHLSNALDMFGFEHVEYFEIVRNLLEEYRLLFINWVAKFDQQDYIIDRWGLFNPPGVGPFDHDPDDDIPFNGFDDM